MSCCIILISTSLFHVSNIVWLHHLYFNKMPREKLDGNYTRMLHAVFNEFWKQHSTKQQLSSQIISVRGVKHAGYCWRSKVKLISNVLLWIYQCGYGYTMNIDTGWHLEYLLKVMTNRDRW